MPKEFFKAQNTPNKIRVLLALLGACLVVGVVAMLLMHNTKQTQPVNTVSTPEVRRRVGPAATTTTRATPATLNSLTAPSSQ